MKRLRFFVIVIVSCFILCLCTSCSTLVKQSNSLSADNIDQTNMLLVEKYVLETKELYEHSDREILNINKSVLSRWYPSGSSIMIIPIDDNKDLLLDEYISLVFDGPPNYDSYGKGGPKAYIVEEFMEEINKKSLENVVLNSFIQKDLIITLEFSDGSKVVFDAYYKEIEDYVNDL